MSQAVENDDNVRHIADRVLAALLYWDKGLFNDVTAGFVRDQVLGLARALLEEQARRAGEIQAGGGGR